MILPKKKYVQARFVSSNNIYSKLIPANDIFDKINDTFDFNFVYDEVKEFYSANKGRPAEDPVRLFKATLVQRLRGLTDHGIEEAARYDIRIKRFLGLEIDDYGFDYSTIWYFRERLGSKTFENIFNNILQQIVKKGIIKDKSHQFADSMPVIANATLPNATALLYMVVKTTIKSLENNSKQELLDLLETTEEKIAFKAKAHPLFKLKKDEREKAFEKGSLTVRKILSFLENNEIENENLELLKQVLNENSDENNKLIQTVKSLKTLSDKDARLGHKTKTKLIFGYKNHSMVTEEGIITAVEVTTAAEKDNKSLEPLINKAEKQKLKPEVVDLDSAYGHIEDFKLGELIEVQINAPFRGVSEERLSIYDLKYDSQTHTVTCPNNFSVKLKGKKNPKAEFDLKNCRACPKKDQCPISNSKVLVFHKDHEVARRALKQQRENSKRKAKEREDGVKHKSRLIVENVFAYLKKLGGKKTKYYNLLRATIHVYLVTTLSNIMKTIRIRENI